MKEIRNAWIDAALEEHARHVDATRRQGEDIITEYFERIGWRWAITKAGGTRYTEALRRANPGLLDYCGIFWGAVGMSVGEFMPKIEAPKNVIGRFLLNRMGLDLEPYKGVQILPAIANRVLPSTYRIEHKGHWDGIPQAERVTVQEMERGDLILVVTRAGKSYGDHFAGVVEVDHDRQIVKTVEANASGILGDGSHGRGVVTRERTFDSIRRIRRFDQRHFVVRR